MAGITSGPSPWWQQGQMGGKLANLQNSAPPGYAYDPIAMGYQRTPTSAGQNVAAFDSAALNVPSINAITGGSGSLTAGGVGTGLGVPGVGGVGTSAGTVGAPGATGTSTGPVTAGGGLQMPDMSASNSAQFAAAKDQVGQQSRASLNSLSDEMASMGMSGSGAAAKGAEDIISSGAGNLGQVSRDLATQNANTALDVAKTNYQGGITQRGQDIQAQQANAQLAIENRNSQYQMLSTILNSLSRLPASGSGTGSQYAPGPALY